MDRDLHFLMCWLANSGPANNLTIRFQKFVIQSTTNIRHRSKVFAQYLLVGQVVGESLNMIQSYQSNSKNSLTSVCVHKVLGHSLSHKYLSCIVHEWICTSTSSQYSHIFFRLCDLIILHDEHDFLSSQIPHSSAFIQGKYAPISLNKQYAYLHLSLKVQVFALSSN